MWNKSLESWLRGPRPAVVERELQPVLERGLVFAVVGPRKAGKTFYLYQLGRTLDVRLVGLRPSHFSSFLSVAAEYRGALLLLDEVPHWGVVLGLY